MRFLRIAARVAAGPISPPVAAEMDTDHKQRRDWISKWFEESKTPPEDIPGLIEWITGEKTELDKLDDESIDVLYAKLRDEGNLEPLPVDCNADLDHPCDADVDANGERTGCPGCKSSMEEAQREYGRMRPDQHEDMRRQTDPEYGHRRQQEDDDELRDAGRGHLVKE